MAPTGGREALHLTSPAVVLVLGLFLLCLVNSASFRRAIGLFFKTSYQVFRAVVIEPIRWIVQSPLVAADSSQPAVHLFVPLCDQAADLDRRCLAVSAQRGRQLADFGIGRPS